MGSVDPYQPGLLFFGALIIAIASIPLWGPWGQPPIIHTAVAVDARSEAPAPKAAQAVAFTDTDESFEPHILDACPGQTEDQDGFEDGDGCPDLDNDRDGLRDESDACPDFAEDRNGINDRDGCPEFPARIATVSTKTPRRRALPRRRITLDLYKADVRDVLRLFARESGRNIVFGNEVQGRITASLDNVPLDNAFHAILAATSLDYERTGAAVLVQTP